MIGRRVVLREELPRLPHEKVDRVALSERAASLVEQPASESR